MVHVYKRCLFHAISVYHSKQEENNSCKCVNMPKLIFNSWAFSGIFSRTVCQNRFLYDYANLTAISFTYQKIFWAMFDCFLLGKKWRKIWILKSLSVVRGRYCFLLARLPESNTYFCLEKCCIRIKMYKHFSVVINSFSFFLNCNHARSSWSRTACSIFFYFE